MTDTPARGRAEAGLAPGFALWARCGTGSRGGFSQVQIARPPAVRGFIFRHMEPITRV
jgi:hypothetical protein